MSAQATEKCFDFNHPITSALKDPIPLKKNKKDALASGANKEKDFYWGGVRGMVDKPLAQIYTQLLDHFTIKDRSRVKLRIYDQPREGFDKYHLVMVSLETMLATVDWEEQWGYTITEGTPAAPKALLISYQKSDGSKYIPHMCGSIVLKEASANSTDVFLYEEINALGKRSPEDTVKGHIGTLAALRK